VVPPYHRDRLVERGIDPRRSRATARRRPSCAPRGLQRWNQGYCATHKTLFDGTITADALKSQVAAMGREADRVFAACGGRDDRTSRDDEDSFHAAW
jgi:hypothetical protein